MRSCHRARQTVARPTPVDRKDGRNHDPQQEGYRHHHRHRHYHHHPRFGPALPALRSHLFHEEALDQRRLARRRRHDRHRPIARRVRLGAGGSRSVLGALDEGQRVQERVALLVLRAVVGTVARREDVLEDVADRAGRVAPRVADLLAEAAQRVVAARSCRRHRRRCRQHVRHERLRRRLRLRCLRDGKRRRKRRAHVLLGDGGSIGVRQHR
eukprot:4643111-Prymnesium_polylepis.1